MTNGVVGSRGSTMPAAPIPTLSAPVAIQTTRKADPGAPVAFASRAVSSMLLSARFRARADHDSLRFSSIGPYIITNPANDATQASAAIDIATSINSGISAAMIRAKAAITMPE